MNLENIKELLPVVIFDELPIIIDKYGINTVNRLSHFLAQTSHESAGFKQLTENLNYSNNALMSLFRKYFPTIESTVGYAREQEKIANKVYANRMGNGNEESGDGWRFKGRGAIQLTGKNNYTAFGKSINKDLVTFPEYVSIKYPLESAAWFWDINKINAISDLGDTDLIVEKVTKKVNGGLHGIEDRKEQFYKFNAKLKTV